jgi:hypothetical protein
VLSSRKQADLERVAGEIKKSGVSRIQLRPIAERSRISRRLSRKLSIAMDGLTSWLIMQGRTSPNGQWMLLKKPGTRS